MAKQAGNKTFFAAKQSRKVAPNLTTRIFNWVKEHKVVTVLLGLFSTGAYRSIGIEHDRSRQIQEEQAIVRPAGMTAFSDRVAVFAPEVWLHNSGGTTAYKLSGELLTTLISPDMPEPTFDAANYKSNHPMDLVKDSEVSVSNPLFAGEPGADKLATENRYLEPVRDFVPYKFFAGRFVLSSMEGWV